MSERSNPIGLDVAALDAAFPFRFTLSPESKSWGRLQSAGPRLFDVAPLAKLGLRFEEIFALDGVSGATAEEPLPHPEAAWLLKPRGRDDAFLLRGQFVPVGADGTLVFLGAPWVSDLEDLSRYGLSLRDFPAHESLGDMLLLLQTRKTALEDLRESNRKLSEAAAALDERNRRLEQELEHRQRLELRLRQIQKMEAIGLLAGGIAHDFNNLMTAILGFASLASEACEPGSAAREHLEQVEKITQRATALTSQLLTFSRRQVFQPRVVDLLEQCRESESLLRRLLGEQVHLKAEHAGGPLPVRIDPNALQQVIMNLAVNARDAMPDGGTLTMRTFEVPADDPSAALAGVPRVVLEIGDQGCGMSPETIERIFEPFFTTKPQGQGTGIGLATVYGIVQQAGGEVSVESTLGDGSRFRIWLPRCEGEVEGEAATGAKQQRSRPAATVLLVEDEPAIRSLLEIVLRGAGFTVHAAGAPTEAITKSSKIERLDVLVTDVGLPGMPGPELAEAIRACHPHAKILFISGYAEDAAFRRSVHSGDHEFLQKPFQPSELVDRIVDLMVGRRSREERLPCTE